jgi:hypothetical protein
MDARQDDGGKLMSRPQRHASRFKLPKGRPPALQELLQELHSMHARANYPSARWISRHYDVTQGAVLNLFKNEPKHEPPRPVVLLTVARCLAREMGLNEDEVCDRFDSRWKQAFAETEKLRADD